MCNEEHVGPISDHDELCAVLGPGHPHNAEDVTILIWYDGPIISIMSVAGDPRPRLDIKVDDGHSGEEATRIFTSVHHQLVFDRLETLNATLDQGCPTLQSYRLAEHIIRYRTRSTRTNHPEPSHEVWTSRHEISTLPNDELPGEGMPQGLKVPGMVEDTEENSDAAG